MKRLILTTFGILLFALISAFSQTEIRNLPYYLDVRWHSKPDDYVRTAHLKPTPMPPEARKLPPAPERIQTEQGVELINISQAPSHQSECYIVISPFDPSNIVVASNDYRFMNKSAGYRMVNFYSTDGGKTWDEARTPRFLDYELIEYPEEGGATIVDPGLGFDGKGNLYYCFLFSQIIEGSYTQDNGVFVVKSTDGGKTWLEDELGIPVIKYNGHLQDKCFIGVDHHEDSPYTGRTYVAWYNTEYPFSIGFAYAEGGINFGATSSVKGSSGNSVQSPLPVVAPNGDLYVVWEVKTSGGTKTSAIIQKSTDGGDSWVWDVPKTAQTVNTAGTRVGSRMALDDKGDMRISSHPSLDINPNTGELYLVQAGKDENGKYGVFLAKSTDGGETWDPGSRQVENLHKVDGNTYGNDVFLASVAVDPVTNLLAVLYYSSENDTINNTGCDAFVAVSFDDGETFNHIQLTDTWYFNYNSVEDAGGDNLGRYWGDYTTIDAYDGKIYPCFWMPTSGNANFWSVDLFTALLSTAPEPPTNLTVENSWEEPSKVILHWEDPALNNLGGSLDEFNVFVFRNGDKIGEVESGVEKFTDNNAVEGEEYVYSLKTHIASTGEQSKQVTVSLIAGGALQPKEPLDVKPVPTESGIQLIWTNPVEHIDDSYLHDLSDIEIFVDGQLTETVSGDAIQAGESSSAFLELETGTFYKIKIRAKTTRGEHTGFSGFTNEIIAYAGAVQSELSESFDNAEELTPMYIEGDWGIVSTVYKSEGNSFTDSPEGEYANADTSFFIIAPVPVKTGETTLAFDHIALISKQDIGIIMISNDFGATYEHIAWIDASRSEGFDDDNWEVNESEWFSDGIDLSDYEGDTVYVRFELRTNAFVNKDGWYIDNLEIGDFPVGVRDYTSIENGLDVSFAPNPAKNEGKLRFKLSRGARAVVSIYNSLGAKAKEVVSGENLSPGEYEYNVDLSDLNSGAYYLRLSFDGFTKTKPIIINR